MDTSGTTVTDQSASGSATMATGNSTATGSATTATENSTENTIPAMLVMT